MPSFRCEECRADIIDSPYGYITECVHWPAEALESGKGVDDLFGEEIEIWGSGLMQDRIY